MSSSSTPCDLVSLFQVQFRCQVVCVFDCVGDVNSQTCGGGGIGDINTNADANATGVGTGCLLDVQNNCLCLN